MAGILDFLGLGNSQPTGGILSAPAAPPSARVTPPWASALGMFGASLQDAGDYLGGRPSDATNIDNYQKYTLQQQLRQAYATAATAQDPAARQQAYSMIAANGGDPSALMKMRADSQMPGLLAAMQPNSPNGSINDVQVTPQASMSAPTPGGNANAPTVGDRLAAMGPTTSGLPLMGALKNFPELASTMAPSILNNQMEMAMKSVHPASLPQKQAGGYNANDPVMVDAYGNLSSPVKPQAAVTQGFDIARNTPITPEQAETNRLKQADIDKPISVGMGGMYDPKTQKIIGGLPLDGGANAGGNKDVHGEAYLSTLNPQIASTVKAIGDGRMAPLSGFALARPQGMQLMAAVNQYNPNFDATQMPMRTKARNDFATGKNGNTVRSLNVAISHLDTLGDLSDALGNGNLQAVNTLGQNVSQWTGGQAPTNFDTAKTIVGDEITKAIIGTGGSVADREKAQAVISRANSPQQLKGAIQTYQALLGGQLGGLRQQYGKTTGLQDFNDFLSPETQQVIGNIKPAKAAGPPSPASLPQKPPAGWTLHQDARGNKAYVSPDGKQFMETK